MHHILKTNEERKKLCKHRLFSQSKESKKVSLNAEIYTVPFCTVDSTDKDSSNLAVCYKAWRVCQDKSNQLKHFRSLLTLLTIRSQVEACCRVKMPRLVLTDLRPTHAMQNCRLLTVSSNACLFRFALLTSFKLPSKSSSSVIAFAYILHTSEVLMMKNHPKNVHIYSCAWLFFIRFWSCVVPCAFNFCASNCKHVVLTQTARRERGRRHRRLLLLLFKVPCDFFYLSCLKCMNSLYLYGPVVHIASQAQRITSRHTNALDTFVSLFRSNILLRPFVCIISRTLVRYISHMAMDRPTSYRYTIYIYTQLLYSSLPLTYEKY